MRRFIQTTGLMGLGLLLTTFSVFAQGAGIEEDMNLLDAVIAARKALEVAEKNVGPDHPDVAGSLDILAGLYHEQGQYALAEPLYKRALAIFEKAHGPDVAMSLNNLAILYRATKRETQAKELEKRAARIISLPEKQK